MTSAIRYLVLLVTTACNLRCAYCYRGDGPSQNMPFDTAREALELAARSGGPFHVQFSGGEPTLALKIVEQVAVYIRKRVLPATIALQTNGTRVDDDLIALCQRHGIQIGLSIDGPPAVQERLRGQAAATYRGLALLSQAKIPVRVTSVLSRENASHLPALAMALAAFDNVTGFGLDILVRKGLAEKRDELAPDDASVAAGVRALLATLGYIERNRAIKLRWRELEAVKQALNGPAGERAYCHACQGESLAVMPDGHVYPCAQTAGDEAMAGGTIWDVDWHRLRRAYAGVVLRGPCADCPLSGRCPGDCPSRLTYNAGRIGNGMCAVYRTIATLLREEGPR